MYRNTTPARRRNDRLRRVLLATALGLFAVAYALWSLDGYPSLSTLVSGG
jgi:hypothetical protein